MAITIIRKCKACQNPVEVDKDDINNVVYYKGVYYHKTCFVNLAKTRANSKRGKPEEWKYALDHLQEFEQAAIDKLEYPFIKENFNQYLLDNYNVTSVPDRLWEVTGALEKGIYKRKKCRPVSIKILHEAWIWGQHKLNKINVQNKMNKKGPENDNERVLYDLAILVGKIPNYLAHKSKMEAIRAETERAQRESVRINYDNMQRTEIKHEGLDDISALLDEF